MKRIYGTIFKELRLNKGYSIKEISDTEVSKATISKFEHGAAMISIDKFFRLLSNINVSPGEFTLYVEERLDIPYSFSSATNNFSAFQDKQKNLVKVEKTIKRLEDQIQKFPERKFLRIQIINLKAIISQAIPDYKDKIDARDRQVIKQHLLVTKNWNDFELRIYCSTIHLFDLPTIELLTHKLLNPFNYRLITPDIKWMMSVALVNLTDALLIHGAEDLTESTPYFKQIIRYLEDHPIPNKHIAEKAFVKFNIGSHYYLINQTERGLEDMREVIQGLSLLGCDEWANALILEFEKLTKTSYLEL